MKKSIIIMFMIVNIFNNLFGMDKDYFNKSVDSGTFNYSIRDTTPLQKDVLIHGGWHVETILNPPAESNLKKVVKFIKREKAPTEEELCDQITTANYFNEAGENTLFHTVAGSFPFRILERRLFPQLHEFIDEHDTRKFKELGIYDPYLKSVIIHKFIELLAINDRLKGVINKPGKDGYTPLQLAVISALIFTKNGMNGANITYAGAGGNYGALREILECANRCHGDYLHSLAFNKTEHHPSPAWFAKGKNFEKYFSKRPLPSDILKLYRHAFCSKNNAPEEDMDLEVDETARERVAKALKIPENPDDD